MKLFLYSIVALFTIQVFAQNPTFGNSERLTFTASYNMSGLMTDIAQITMETSEVKTSKSTLYRLKCKAQTYSKWDKFFKIDDLYESYVNRTTVKPYLYKRDINEGGYFKKVQYKYNHKTQTINSKVSKRNSDGTWYDKSSNFNFGSNSRDIVSTIYHLRTLDIHKATVGSSNHFTVIFDNQETQITFKLLGTETINTAIGKKECFKLALSMEGNMLKGIDSNIIWLTADAHKIPVYAKFKVPVGNGELRIKTISGLKN